MGDRYDFTPEVRDKILAAFRARVKVLRCPVCGFQAFTAADGFVSPPAYGNYWLNQRVSALPSLALICDHCGNTLFINIGALGLGELVSPSQEELKRRGLGGLGSLRTKYGPE